MTRYGKDMGENKTVSMIRGSRNLRALPFRTSEDQLSTRKSWEVGWKESRENFSILELQVHWII